jgi:hypothetical protein
MEEPKLTISKNDISNEAQDKRKWVYIDLDAHDAEIRRKEREEFYALRKRERERKALHKQKRLDMFLSSLVFRCVGLAFIFLTLILLHSGLLGEDGTWSFMTFGIGILLVIMPGYNNPK